MFLVESTSRRFENKFLHGDFFEVVELNFICDFVVFAQPYHSTVYSQSSTLLHDLLITR